MKDEKYFIKGPEYGNTVEVWSESRLPFEPKGWLLDMRKSVKSAGGTKGVRPKYLKILTRGKEGVEVHIKKLHKMSRFQA